MEYTCRKGHTGPGMPKAGKPGQFTCLVCHTANGVRRRRRLQAAGLTVEGHERRPRDAESRFWLHVTKGALDECWEYQHTSLGKVAANPKSRSSQYRAFHNDDGTADLAHRFSYRLHVGPIPTEGDWTIDHLCENKICVNPAHLELVTRSENSIRRGQRERARKAAA